VRMGSPIRVPAPFTTVIASMSFIRKVVRNDAIKLDPPEVYNWRVFAIACAVRLSTVYTSL
jgi:hypothetical protein